MATDLQLLYLQARVGGTKHYAALRAVARKTGLDEATVDRCLRRANRTDVRDSKKKAS